MEREQELQEAQERQYEEDIQELRILRERYQASQRIDTAWEGKQKELENEHHKEQSPCLQCGLL